VNPPNVGPLGNRSGGSLSRLRDLIQVTSRARATLEAPAQAEPRPACAGAQSQIVVIVQSKVFGARDNSPMTVALWR
jgi:hypothetical protein